MAEAQSRNNEKNREMRRKERAERELKQLKGDISNKVTSRIDNLFVSSIEKRITIFNNTESITCVCFLNFIFLTMFWISKCCCQQDSWYRVVFTLFSPKVP